MNARMAAASMKPARLRASCMRASGRKAVMASRRALCCCACPGARAGFFLAAYHLDGSSRPELIDGAIVIAQLLQYMLSVFADGRRRHAHLRRRRAHTD